MKNYYLLLLLLLLSFSSCNENNDSLILCENSDLENNSYPDFSVFNDSLLLNMPSNCYYSTKADKPGLTREDKINRAKVVIADAWGAGKMAFKLRSLWGVPGGGTIAVISASIVKGAISSIRAYAKCLVEKQIDEMDFSKNKIHKVYEANKGNDVDFLELNIPHSYSFLNQLSGMHNKIVENVIELEILDKTPEGLLLSPANNQLYKSVNYLQTISQYEYIPTFENYEKKYFTSADVINFEDSLYNEIERIYSDSTIFSNNDFFVESLMGGDKDVYPISILGFFFDIMLQGDDINDIIYFANNYIDKISREPTISVDDKISLISAIAVSVNSYLYWTNIDL